MTARHDGTVMLVVLVLGVLAAALPAEPQPAGKVYRIGWLGHASAETQAKERPGTRVNWEAFTQGLRDHGWIENQNVVFERRYTEGRAERYPRLAAELVGLRPDVIATGQGAAIRALKDATTTIPIVMVTAADPVGSGLVASLARPGGNVTGMSIQAPAAGGKRLELLKQAVPKAARVAVLWNAAHPGKAAEFRDTQAAASALKVILQSVEVRGPDDFGRAFSTIARSRPDALITFSESLTLTHQRRIVEFAAERRLPMISEIREFAETGGLMTYGASLPDLFRRAAGHVDKILRGAKPADLPVEQPTKFELVINLKTAKALGLTIPPSLLLRADQVIE